MSSLVNSLGIFVITYNRAQRLDRTLASLFAGPFRDCEITVLDNCSSDETAAVCAAHASRFPRMRIVRHRVNIGLSANYLRAVELSSKPYSWILGDDDDLATTGAEDIIEQIDRAEADLLIVGAVNQPKWALGETTTVSRLLQRGFPYYYITGWITGVIFRTSLFDSESFHLGYKNADNVFPHFPFFAKCAQRDASVYVTREWIAASRDPDAHYGRLGSVMLAGWMHSARYLDDRTQRRLALHQGPLGQGGPLSYRATTVVFFKAFGIHNLVQRSSILDTWLKAFAVSTWDVRLTLLPSAVHLFCPQPVARWAWHIARGGGSDDRRAETYAAVLDEART